MPEALVTLAAPTAAEEIAASITMPDPVVAAIPEISFEIPAMAPPTVDLTIPAGPSDDEDPVKSWTNLQSAVSRALADPEVATRAFDSPLGRMSLEQAIDMMFTGDLLVHTWDLARATGLDETLDAHHVHRMFAGMEPYDEMLRTSGHYGPRVAVADDADEQTKFIAFMGRNP